MKTQTVERKEMSLPPLPELIYQHGEETWIAVQAYAAAVREAALEEAAVLMEYGGVGYWDCRDAPEAIRALKNA